MMFKLPQFNLLCNIWQCSTPSAGAASYTDVPCQKYVYSRFQTDTTPAEDSDWWEHYVPPIHIRIPRTHASVLGIAPSWTAVIFEVPAGSGSYYRAHWREIMHEGFVNEYAVFITSQCDSAGLAIPPAGVTIATGVAPDACISPPPPPPPPPIILQDNMDDSAGVNLIVHVMDQGPGWDYLGSTSNIEEATGGVTMHATANAATFPAFAASLSNFHDGTCVAQFWIDDTTSDFFGILGRVQSEGSWYSLSYDASSLELDLTVYTAGVATGLDSALLSAPPAHGDVLAFTLTLSGSSLTGSLEWIANSETINVSATDTTWSTGDQWGFFISSGTDARIDAFEATP